jgi:branched-chain amino acid transport system permease protein
MSLESMAQNIVYGLFIGGIYGIAAVGLALAFGVMNVLNIAHGELLMFGGYISFWLFSLLGIDPFVSLIICIPALFGIGLLLDRLVYRHVARLRRGQDQNSLLIVLAWCSSCRMAIRLFADERTIPVSISDKGSTSSGSRALHALDGFGIALVTILALHLFLQSTDSGKAIRATQKIGSGQTPGINVHACIC